jgi:hypothetical protein
MIAKGVVGFGQGSEDNFINLHQSSGNDVCVYVPGIPTKSTRYLLPFLQPKVSEGALPDID